jgi:hypothetical protein
MRNRHITIAAATVTALFLAASAGWAQTGGLFTPSVPVSAFARPASWLDPSRLQISTEFSVGTGFGGSQGLQVTRLSYRLGAPLAMSVSVGNTFGGGRTFGGGGNGMFLEGLDLSYRPLPSMTVQFHYNDLRSPLQLQRYYDYWR